MAYRGAGATDRPDTAGCDPDGVCRRRCWATALLLEFTQALSDFGWIEGRNLRIDIRWAPGRIDLMRTFAKELVSLQPDAFWRIRPR